MTRSLRIVFMGTPEFAVESLQAIHRSHHEVVAVVTVADKPAGRGKQLHMSAVKEYALTQDLPVLQPLKLRDPDFIESLKALKADLFVVVAFRMLPELVWQMPPMGTINLHGSLLPRYRGAAPINRAIMNGETQTGVTTFFLRQEIDTGSVIEQAILPISENETAGELHDRMMHVGAQTLLHTIGLIASGDAQPMPQEEMIGQGVEVIHAPKIFKEDCRIDWTRSVHDIHNHVRGLSPYPAAFTMLGDKTLKVYMGRKELHTELHSPPASVDTDNKTYLRFTCADGWYSVTDMQLEGKKRMGVEEFLRGWRAS